MSSPSFVLTDGFVSHSCHNPPVAAFLESHPGAYTTTRTHSNASCLLFWERHLHRLANSARILLNSNPELLFKSSLPLHWSPSSSMTKAPKWESTIGSLVNASMKQVLPVTLRERSDGHELAITTLVSGNFEKLNEMEYVGDDGVSGVLDVHIHIGTYVPPAFGVPGKGAHLAVVGRGRDVAAAKYSDWVRLRKPLEKLRPPSVTELLLSNDGDRILEGSITNFFVVCRKDKSKAEGSYLHDNKSSYSVEVLTAPIFDGVLPGVIRQVVIDVCLSKGIPLREVAPSLATHELWEEAFITNSLRVLQHVETVMFPSSWELLESKCSEEISWNEKRFKDGPGMITTLIQKEIMERANWESYRISEFE